MEAPALGARVSLGARASSPAYNKKTMRAKPGSSVGARLIAPLEFVHFIRPERP